MAGPGSPCSLSLWYPAGPSPRPPPPYLFSVSCPSRPWCSCPHPRPARHSSTWPELSCPSWNGAPGLPAPGGERHSASPCLPGAPGEDPSHPSPAPASPSLRPVGVPDAPSALTSSVQAPGPAQCFYHTPGLWPHSRTHCGLSPVTAEVRILLLRPWAPGGPEISHPARGCPPSSPQPSSLGPTPCVLPKLQALRLAGPQPPAEEARLLPAVSGVSPHGTAVCLGRAVSGKGLAAAPP